MGRGKVRAKGDVLKSIKKGALASAPYQIETLDQRVTAWALNCLVF